MALSSGTRLGPYEIRSALGAGGMGEVYRARDSKLNRDVAIKVLPDLFANDPDRLTRFRREAQVLAALNRISVPPPPPRIYHAAVPGDVSPASLIVNLRSGPAGRFAARLRDVTASVDPNLRLDGSRASRTSGFASGLSSRSWRGPSRW